MIRTKCPKCDCLEVSLKDKIRTRYYQFDDVLFDERVKIWVCLNPNCNNEWIEEVSITPYGLKHFSEENKKRLLEKRKNANMGNNFLRKKIMSTYFK